MVLPYICTLLAKGAYSRIIGTILVIACNVVITHNIGVPLHSDISQDERSHDMI